MRRLAAALAVLLLAGSGCGGGGLTPKQRLRNDTAAVVESANAKDESGLRNALKDLRSEADAQERSGQLSSRAAQVLRALIAAVEADAGLLSAPVAPDPSPTQDQPSPTPAQTTPPPSPTPAPTKPAPTEQPPTSPPPQTLPPILGGSPSPSRAATG